MTDRTFTYTLTAGERFAILIGLGFLHTKIQTLPDEIKAPIDKLITKMTTAPGQDAQLSAEEQRRMGQQKDDARMANASGAAPAHAILSPPAPTDYFARNRKGDTPTKAPEGAVFCERQIVGTAKTGKYLKVILQHDGVGAATANCFDSQLWPILERHQGKRAGLWLLQSSDGKYWNLVGVRA